MQRQTGGSAAGKCLRSKQIHAKRGVFVHALRVQVGGGAPTPVFYPAFSKTGEMFPKGNGFILFASTKRTGSSRRAAALSTPGERFKTLQNSFFVLLPSFVPKPACGATRFFGCFEPVRKGYCSADARLMFFGKGLLYSKLTGASRIRKGKLHVIFVAVGI